MAAEEYWLEPAEEPCCVSLEGCMAYRWFELEVAGGRMDDEAVEVEVCPETMVEK
jgi:hypothetical protein